MDTGLTTISEADIEKHRPIAQSMITRVVVLEDSSGSSNTALAGTGRRFVSTVWPSPPGTSTRASSSCCGRSASIPTRGSGIRTSSPAASGSGSRSPVRWRPVPMC